MDRYEWICLDADGTLLDFDRAERLALEETLAVDGIRLTQTMLEGYHRINEGLWKKLEQGQILRDRLQTLRFEQFLASNGLSGDPAAMNERYRRRLATHGETLPHAEETLKRLSRKHRLALITNGTRLVQEGRLRASGLEGYFAHIFISEVIGRDKPSEAFFDACFAGMGWPDRTRVLVVGDSVTADMAGGMRYGTDTCWYNPKGKMLPSGMHVTYEIRDLRQL